MMLFQLFLVVCDLLERRQLDSDSKIVSVFHFGNRKVNVDIHDANIVENGVDGVLRHGQDGRESIVLGHVPRRVLGPGGAEGLASDSYLLSEP